ncbi:uncharacterized protein LOC109939084 isoform X1 [Rhincodon typus]|uniref:uncharacterized protein LOC109939084 isoform X1 n=2 Tax=Rhincodon typus TaxID=259920 RepID=UPI00202F83D4|nr:uncharacterized protein LOC109939084 isoform X1 [Rhincodon typus]
MIFSETLRKYFLCDQENPNHCCKRENCRMYHEKVSYINGCYRSANEVPVLAEERRIERNKFMEKNYSQTQMSLKSAMQFIKISVEFIQCAVGSKKLSRERGKQYVKEILHTILFLCYINNPSFEPRDVLEESVESWSNKLPDVFEQYKTHLPTRPPYTILLEIVVDLEKSNITELILDTLSSLNTQMTVDQNPQEGRRCGNVFCYISTVISCCFFYNLATKQKTDNYFGASVSCFGRHQRELMIDILCYRTWNEDISLAVCMASERMNTGLQQAIQFRPIVYCNAYQIKSNSNMQTRTYSGNGKHQQHTPIPPCRKCLDMFPDIGNNLQQQNNDRAFWPYGNCAEVESLSRLLNAHGYICNRMPAPVGVRFTLQFLKRKRRGRIIHNLKLFNFHVDNNILFYTPDDLQNAV